MKRKTKNIIMIIGLVILLVLNGLTVYLGTEHSTSTLNNDRPTIENNNGMPDMANNNGDNSSTESTTNTPPEKPSDDTNSNSNDTNTPPEKPDNDTNNNGSDNNTPPEKPDGDSSSNSNNNSSNNDNKMTPPSNDKNMSFNKEDSSVDTLYIVLFGIESLLISSLLIYLLMTGFNKKSMKELFENKDKLLIYILSVIILTSAITYIDTFTSNKIMNNSNNEVTNNSNSNNSTNNNTYSASLEITSDKDITEGTYESSSEDENAILVSGDVTSNISNVTVNKTGDSDGGDNTSFYGTNSAIIAKDGAKLVLKNIDVTTNADGANGVFSYGGSATTSNTSSDGTTIEISDSTITTTKDNSGGIMTTGGGIMKATNLTINTSGTSSAAIRTDRGGGTVTVSKGTYTTTGKGSPAIYSTADVTVSDATLVSKASEGIIIEGKNSVTIDNVTLTDTNSSLNGQSTTYKNIFLYQSMSGDADTGVATFTAKDSTITTNKGDSFYVTNTSAVINLTNNKIINNDKTGNFLRIQKDSWGTEGSNGGTVTLNMTNQDVAGNIVVDSISTLTMNMTGSSFTGSINTDNTAKSISLVLDKTSSIKLTGDTYVTSLVNKDSTNSNIDFNGYKLYVNGTAIN